MKRKVLLSLIAGCLTFGAVAQEQIKNNMPKGFPEDATGIDQLKPNTQTFKKGGPISAWFDMTDYINFSIPGGANVQTYASFIYPDSNVIFVPQSDSGFYWYQTSVGSILDPSDINMALYTDYFERHDTYEWDSLSFLYIYRRGTIDSGIVDTLYIDLFDRTGLTIRSGFQGNSDLHSRPVYDSIAQKGIGAFKTITVLLTPEEQTNKSDQGWSFGILTEHVGQTMTAVLDPQDPKYQGNWFQTSGGAWESNGVPNMIGFVLRFKPGYTWNTNDTMEISPQSTLSADNKLSYFGFRSIQNEGDINNQINNGKYYTHALVQRKEQVHGGEVNGWEGYLPGNAFFERQYMDCGFYLSGSSSVSVEKLNEFGSALGKAYPNPAGQSGKLNIEYAVKSATEVSINIYDIYGNKVKTVVNGVVGEGDHTATVDISDLTSGVYIYTMTDGNNYAASQKVTIVR